MPSEWKLNSNHQGGQDYRYRSDGSIHIMHSSLQDETSYPVVENILIRREEVHPADAECDPAQRLVRNDHSYGGCTIRVWTRDGKMIHMEINVV